MHFHKLFPVVNYWLLYINRRINDSNLLCTFNISTSKAHLSMCRVLNIFLAVLRLINWKYFSKSMTISWSDDLTLNPHWVSWTVLTAKIQTQAWKPYMRRVLMAVLLAILSFSKWDLDPQTTPSSSLVISSRHFSSLDKSLNVVAPSASANNKFSPLEL